MFWLGASMRKGRNATEIFRAAIVTFGKVRPIYWGALIRNIHHLAPHLGLLFDHGANKFSPQHIDIIMDNLDVLAPKMAVLLKLSSEVQKSHLDHILPHIGSIVLHMDVLEPHLSAMARPEVMESLIPHLDSVVRHMGDIKYIIGALLKKFDAVRPHLPALVGHMDQIHEKFHILLEHEHLLERMCDNGDLVIKFLGPSLVDDRLGFLLERFERMEPYFPLFDAHGCMMFAHWDQVQPHFDTLLDNIAELAPQMHVLEPHMGCLMAHMDALGPHMRSLVTHLDALQPALPILCKHMDALVATGELEVLLGGIDMLKPVMNDLSPYLPELIPHMSMLLPQAPKLIPHTKMLLKHMDCWAPHLPVLMQKLPQIADHIDCLAPSLDYMSPHVAALIPHLDEILPYSEVLIANFAFFLPYFHRSLPLAVKYLPAIAKRCPGGKAVDSKLKSKITDEIERTRLCSADASGVGVGVGHDELIKGLSVADLQEN